MTHEDVSRAKREEIAASVREAASAASTGDERADLELMVAMFELDAEESAEAARLRRVARMQEWFDQES